MNTVFVSLLASARLHEIEPLAYMRDLLCLLPSWPSHRVLRHCAARRAREIGDLGENSRQGICRRGAVLDHGDRSPTSRNASAKVLGAGRSCIEPTPCSRGGPTSLDLALGRQRLPRRRLVRAESFPSRSKIEARVRRMTARRSFCTRPTDVLTGRLACAARCSGRRRHHPRRRPIRVPCAFCPSREWGCPYRRYGCDALRAML